MTRARDLADGKFSTDAEVENSSGATLKLTSTDTTGADTELLGQIDFVSSDSSTGSAGTQARIKGVYEDNGDSSGIAFLAGASTGSGTPTISEVMRIRHEGNVGIGTASPTRKLELNNGATGSFVTFTDGVATNFTFKTDGSNVGTFGTEAGSTHLAFMSSGSEQMRISTGGNIRFFQTGSDSPGNGNTTTGHAFQPGGIVNFSSAAAYVSINRNGDGTRIQFNNSGNTRGSITVTGTTTAYNTSSDRRLKSNIQDSASASSKIDAMKVRQFDWTEDGKHQDYGMIAQELQSIEPLAVSGSEDSNKMMGVDYSILVPMLIKEIQELRSRVAALEAS